MIEKRHLNDDFVIRINDILETVKTLLLINNDNIDPIKLKTGLHLLEIVSVTKNDDLVKCDSYMDTVLWATASRDF